ncbi:MAG: hypothetical protein WCK73_16640 [Deltaproteobacteria bacterium]
MADTIELGKAKGGMAQAMVWMLVLSLLLFWIPVLGMLIAGMVGGRKAGSLGSALGAALLPALVVAVVMFFMATALTGMPILGVVAGFGGGVLVVANVVPLLAGAVVGGILAR